MKWKTNDHMLYYEVYRGHVDYLIGKIKKVSESYYFYDLYDIIEREWRKKDFYFDIQEWEDMSEEESKLWYEASELVSILYEIEKWK